MPFQKRHIKIILGYILGVISAFWIVSNSLRVILLKYTPVTISGTLEASDSCKLIISNQMFNTAGTSELQNLQFEPNDIKSFSYAYSNGNELKKQKGISIYCPKNNCTIYLNQLNFESWIFTNSYQKEVILSISKLVKRGHNDTRTPTVENSRFVINPDNNMFMFTTETEFYNQFWFRIELISIIISIFLISLFTLLFRVRITSWIKRQSFNNLVLLFTVSAIILFFVFAPKTYDTPEKRNLQEFPKISNTFIWNIPSQIDAWYKDHFPYRNSLPIPLNYFKLKAFDISPTPQKVMKGKGNWLYSSEGHIIEPYIGQVLFTDIELKKIKSIIEERRDYLNMMGSSYHFMLLPMKATIYPEYLPSALKPKSSHSKLEQLISYLKENTSISVVEVKDALLDKKNSNLLYYETDTHWNQLGGFYGYQQLMKKINADTDFNLNIIQEDQIHYDKYLESSGDLLTMINLVGYINRTVYKVTFPKQNQQEVPPHPFDTLKFEGPQMIYENTSMKAAPKLMLYRDSYASYFIKPISQSFSRTAFYWTRTFFQEPIDFEKPDVFVDEYLERFIDHLLNENPVGIQNAVKEFRASQQADSLHNSTLPEHLD